MDVDIAKLNDSENFGDFKVMAIGLMNDFERSKGNGGDYTNNTRHDVVLKVLCLMNEVSLNFLVNRKKARRILKILSACSEISKDSIEFSINAERNPSAIEIQSIKNRMNDEEYNKLTKRDSDVIPIESVIAIALSKNFYQTREWRQVRYQAFRIYSNFCQCCGRKRSESVWLEADHIKPRSLAPELALDVSNIQILCMDCNQGKSNLDCTDWRD